MTGYLYQFFGEGIEELYWSPKEIKEDVIKAIFLSMQNSDLEDENFEEYWNQYMEIKIERVFVNEIYV